MPPRTRPRAPAFAPRVRSAAARAVAIALLACLVACEPNIRVVEQSFSQPVDTVDVDGPSGDVSLQLAPTDGGELVVARYLRWNAGEPDASWVVTGGTLELRSGCDTPTDVCDAAYDITSPLPITLRTRTGTGHGNVTLHGARSVVVSRTDGRVELAQISESIAVVTTSGAVTGARLWAHTNVIETGSGAVGLAFTRAPDRLEIRSESGDVTALVPEGAYDIIIVAPEGDVTIDGVDDDPRSERVISITTARGDVELHGVPDLPP